MSVLHVPGIWHVWSKSSFHNLRIVITTNFTETMGFQQALLLTIVTASQCVMIGTLSLLPPMAPSVEPIDDVVVGEQLSVGSLVDPLLLQAERFSNATKMDSSVDCDDCNANDTDTSSFMTTTSLNRTTATATSTATMNVPEEEQQQDYVDDHEEEDDDDEDMYDHDYTKCPNPRDEDTMLPIWGPSAYELLQSKYRHVVGDNLSSLTKVKEEGDVSSFSSKSGVLVPVEIRKSQGKGRGVHALTKIPKGTKVWEAKQHAIFYYQDDFLEYLSLLPFQLACDVLVWAYVEENCPKDPRFIAELEGDYLEEGDCVLVAAVELDEGSTFNSIPKMDMDKKSGYRQIPELSDCKDLILQSQIDGSHGDTGVFDNRVEQCNIKTPSDTIYAMRDIQAGEELLIDYGTMNEDEDLEWFDDLVKAAGFDHPYV